MRPAAAAPPVSEPEIRRAADLEARLAEVERRLTASEAYDAAENLIGAYGYYWMNLQAMRPACSCSLTAIRRPKVPSS